MSLRVVSGWRFLVGTVVVGLGVALTASPAAAQSGTGTTTGALSNLTTAQLLAAVSALQKLSTDSGVSLSTLAAAAGITLPGGTTSTGSTTPPTLTAAQQTAVQADLQALSTATGVPVSQLSAIATAAGLSTSSTGTGTSGTGTTGTGTTGGGNTGSGGTTTGTGSTGGTTSGTGGNQTSTGGRTTTTTLAAATPTVPFPEVARPVLFGQRMPTDVEDVLVNYSAGVMQFLLDEYDFEPETPTLWLYNFMTVFDNKATELWPQGYVRPGLEYWMMKTAGLIE